MLKVLKKGIKRAAVLLLAAVLAGSAVDVSALAVRAEDSASGGYWEITSCSISAEWLRVYKTSVDVPTGCTEKEALAKVPVPTGVVVNMNWVPGDVEGATEDNEDNSEEAEENTGDTGEESTGAGEESTGAAENV